MKTVKTFTIVSDPDSNERLYINGRKEFVEGDTIYAIDFLEAADGHPIVIEFDSIDFSHDEWPETLSQAKVIDDWAKQNSTTKEGGEENVEG